MHKYRLYAEQQNLPLHFLHRVAMTHTHNYTHNTLHVCIKPDHRMVICSYIGCWVPDATDPIQLLAWYTCIKCTHPIWTWSYWGMPLDVPSDPSFLLSISALYTHCMYSSLHQHAKRRLHSIIGNAHYSYIAVCPTKPGWSIPSSGVYNC
jgi:hypothetical protein